MDLALQEYNEPKRLPLYLLLGAVVIIGTFGIGLALGLTSPEREIVVNLEEMPLNVEWYSPTYPFLPEELSVYIECLCEQLGIDTDLAVAILLQENPEINIEATHRNENGTIDVGLWQLNDKYLYSDFAVKFWKFDIELDPYNWKHNTYIALNHIHWLQQRLKVQEDIICAYNCGIGAVMNNKIPDSTKIYLRRVVNNYNLLKKEQA